jgi:hypothetical protein
MGLDEGALTGASGHVPGVQEEREAVRSLVGGYARPVGSLGENQGYAEASSTAEAQGPSWWEPMITTSSSAPGSSPTML